MSVPAPVNPLATAPSGTFSAQVITSSKTGVQSGASRVQEVPRVHALTNGMRVHIRTPCVQMRGVHKSST